MKKNLCLIAQNNNPYSIKLVLCQSCIEVIALLEPNRKNEPEIKFKL